MIGNYLKNHAPVLLSAYNRPDHLRRCVESLSRCIGAEETRVFIAVDAPYRDEDVALNKKVLDYCSGIKGFKDVVIYVRSVNMGAFRNRKQARDDIFSHYSNLIMSEDDNEFSPCFLSFINNGLQRYAHDERVFSISGYTYPVKLTPIASEKAYVSNVFSAWGVGVWKDKFNAVDFETADFFDEFRNPLRFMDFNRKVGDHVFIHLLKAKRQGRIFGDTAMTYHMYKKGMVSIFPITSLVRNWGNDGSGIHCGMNEVYSGQEIDESDECPEPEVAQMHEIQAHRDVLNAHFRESRVFLAKAYASYWICRLRRNLMIESNK